ncbi:calmodulin-dependent protein kinase [Pelomyxa schiedti]|nr:calmodulin-dependent protein kinase [Pelomyxa schiedti]
MASTTSAVTRSTFEELTKELFRRALEPIGKVLEDPKLKKKRNASEEPVKKRKVLEDPKLKKKRNASEEPVFFGKTKKVPQVRSQQRSMDKSHKSLPHDVLWRCMLTGRGAGRTHPRAFECHFRVGQREPRGISLFQSMAEDQHDPKMLWMLGEFYLRGQGTDPDPIKGLQYLYKAADAGSVPALWAISQCYFTGMYGIEKDYAKSVPFLQRGADAGDPDALYILGNCFLGGMGVAEDHSKAAALFQKAADLGLPEACVDLGKLYLQGKGVPVDERKAFPLLQRVVNDPKVGWEAQLNLCDFYLYGMEGVQRDVQKGLLYLQKAVQKGDPEGLFRLGQCYNVGVGVERDIKKAVELFQRSVEGGCATAMYSLSEHYLKGDCVPRDPVKAISLLQNSVEMNDRQGLWRLGRCYDTGEGVTKDVRKAVELYQRSVGRGCVLAMYNLSKHYMSGEGVTFDPEQAVSLLERASEHGYTPAMCKLAHYYKEGKGVDVDIGRAISLLNKAADAGYIKAMNELSVNYSLGQGIPIDMNRAASLIQRAYDMGSNEAAIALGWGLLMGAYDMTRNVQRAIPILKKASEESSDAKTMLAMCYECGVGVAKDMNMANSLFQQVIDKGYTEAIFKVGAYLESGALHGPKDIARAFQLYRRAACAGDQRAQARFSSLLSLCLNVFEELSST